MRFWIYFFSSLPLYPDYFVLLMFFSGIYLLFIGPIIFTFWIIPRIERRYKVRLKVDEAAYYYVPFANWQMPVFAISSYVFFKYIKCDTPAMKRPLENTFTSILKKIKYDVGAASRAEIVVSFISMFFFFSLIISCAVFGFFLITE